MRKHTRVTVKSIKREYPFSNIKIVDKNYILSTKYTVTYDVKLAYRLLNKGYAPVVWGGLYCGHRIFVFEKEDVAPDELPFG